jgi:hypothetical protein
MYLYHYFDKTSGPFLTLSDLPVEEAIKANNNHKRLRAEVEGKEYDENEVDEYCWIPKGRHGQENKMREIFAAKGGKIHRKYPYYMILRNEDMSDEAGFHDGNFIKIPVEEFDMSTVSFTYGDSMQHADPGPFYDKPYKNQVYTYDEILEVINKYGWIVKADNWHWGIPCYIEAQLWSDVPIEKYR